MYGQLLPVLATRETAAAMQTGTALGRSADAGAGAGAGAPQGGISVHFIEV